MYITKYILIHKKANLETLGFTTEYTTVRYVMLQSFFFDNGLLMLQSFKNN
jgi:hypothetical protein